MTRPLISDNTITGNFLRGGMEIQGMYFLGNHPDDINYFSEDMKILNNNYLLNDFLIDIKWDVKSCMPGGDFANVFIADQGIDTRFGGAFKNGNQVSISKDVLNDMWKRYYGKKCHDVQNSAKQPLFVG
jgi:hypothetical protein